MTTKLHVMLDLETAGVCGTAAIFSIGAVGFTAGAAYPEHAFHLRVDVQTGYDVGLEFDQSTLDWWTTQSAAACEELTGTTPLRRALEELAAWLPSSAFVWGNGAAFDNAVLRNAYRACGSMAPWEHWRDRCYRTVSADWPRREQIGTHHNPVDDAVSQIVHMHRHGRAFL